MSNQVLLSSKYDNAISNLQARLTDLIQKKKIVAIVAEVDRIWSDGFTTYILEDVVNKRIPHSVKRQGISKIYEYIEKDSNIKVDINFESLLALISKRIKTIKGSDLLVQEGKNRLKRVASDPSSIFSEIATLKFDEITSGMDQSELFSLVSLGAITISSISINNISWLSTILADDANKFGDFSNDPKACVVNFMRQALEEDESFSDSEIEKWFKEELRHSVIKVISNHI